MTNLKMKKPSNVFIILMMESKRNLRLKIPTCFFRPAVVPEGSTNLAFLGQFVEIPEDVVFTIEYSIRSAQIAVYSLLKLSKEVIPMNQYQYDTRVLFDSFITSFR